jgi:hypothetical protein
VPGIIFSRHERPTRHPDTYVAASSYSPSTRLRQFQIPTPQYVYPKKRQSRDEREAGCQCRHRRVCRRRKAESSSCPSSRVSSYGYCCDECRADHNVSCRAVIAKLLMFTLAMIAGPLGTYYISITRLFIGMSAAPRQHCQSSQLTGPGNATVAGALAAVAANAVLIAYVIVAMSEDDSDDKEKKSQ